MEIKVIEDVLNSRGMGKQKFTEIKVRKNEEFDYYLFPVKDIQNTIAVIKESKIYVDDIPATSEVLQRLPVYESKISVEEYDESEVVALYSEIEIEELYGLMNYIDAHKDEKIIVKIYKNSELPEFRELLNREAKEKLPPEQVSILCEYMKILLDLSNGDRWEKILDYREKASFGKLLKNYSKEVQEFILFHASKRLEVEIRKEMEE